MSQEADRRRPCAYKILPVEDWAESCVSGAIVRSAADRADGFLHLSAADQIAATLARHYAAAGGLVLAELDLFALGAAVKWEPSRGGALFPHVYGPAPMGVVRRVWALKRDGLDQPWVLPERLL